MFDYKIIAYNKLGKVQETENLFCTPDEINDVMYTMSEQFGYAEALDTMDTHCGEYGERPLSLGVQPKEPKNALSIIRFKSGSSKSTPHIW